MMWVLRRAAADGLPPRGSKADFEWRSEKTVPRLTQQFEGERPMFHSLMMLAVEANRVVGLRMMKLMRGGKSARREAELMVSEKIDAAFKAGASLMAGASGNEIVRRYRRRVAANAKRLSKLHSGSPVPKHRRRRRRK
jgi:hypothetical protein